MHAVLWSLLFAGGLWLALSPVGAVTIAKINARNLTGSASNHQRVDVFGLAPLKLATGTTSLTTKRYDRSGFQSWPTASSSNQQVRFWFADSTQRIFNGEYASSIVATENPDAALSLSDWAWYLGNTRTGTVPDPSVSRQPGPTGTNRSGQHWVSVLITFANTVKIKDDETGDVVARPWSRLAWMDFGVSATDASLARDEELEHQFAITDLSIRHINPRSVGALASAGSPKCNHKLAGKQKSGLSPGRACASPHGPTDFVRPWVGEPIPDPDAQNPVVAALVATTAGREGPDPIATIKQVGRRLSHITLPPGAAATFQVRILLDAVHVPSADDARIHFFTRMREVSTTDDEETMVLFASAVEHSDSLNIFSEQLQPPDSAREGQFDPRERSQWAHLLELYNRSLRSHVRSDENPQQLQDSPLRRGTF